MRVDNIVIYVLVEFSTRCKVVSRKRLQKVLGMPRTGYIFTDHNPTHRLLCIKSRVL